MKRIRYIALLHVVLLALVLAACGGTSPAKTVPAHDPTTVHPTPALERAELSGISFWYDPQYVREVKARRVPPGEHMGTQLPAYIEFDFDPDSTDAFPGRDTGIRVFRVRDLEQLDPRYRAGVAAGEPMPLIHATRILRVQERLLSFQNGKGTRAIVQYVQEAMPLNNEHLFYSYQGVTDDGRFYVSASFPVQAAMLPATSQTSLPDIPPPLASDLGSVQTYVDAVNRFNVEATERLERLAADDFTPGLDALDAIIRSLFAGEGSAWSAGPE